MTRNALIVTAVLAIALGSVFLGGGVATAQPTTDGMETESSGNETMGEGTEPMDGEVTADAMGTESMDGGFTGESDMAGETQSGANDTMNEGTSDAVGSGGQPGFGVAVALVAVVAAAVIGLRRWM